MWKTQQQKNGMQLSSLYSFYVIAAREGEVPEGQFSQRSTVGDQWQIFPDEKTIGRNLVH